MNTTREAITITAADNKHPKTIATFFDFDDEQEWDKLYSTFFDFNGINELPLPPSSSSLLITMPHNSSLL